MKKYFKKSIIFCLKITCFMLSTTNSFAGSRTKSISQLGGLAQAWLDYDDIGSGYGNVYNVRYNLVKPYSVGIGGFATVEIFSNYYTGIKAMVISTGYVADNSIQCRYSYRSGTGSVPGTVAVHLGKGALAVHLNYLAIVPIRGVLVPIPMGSSAHTIIN